MRVACKCLCLVLASSFAIILTGCNLSQFGEPSRASSVLPAISGKVHGGQQPISGAAIYLYAANTTVSRGASAALLGSPVLTNASGGFSIGAGAYTCPTPGTFVYLVATGGNPGLPGTVNNTAIGLMVLLGTCSSLSTDAFVTVNELTTVAAVEALAPFMADAAHVGSDAGNPGGLAGAFATAASMVNFATGQIQTAAAGVTQPVALLNTLADILAACVNSAGGSLIRSTPCGMLRSYAGLGGAPDTLTAMLLIVQYPSQNVSQLFGLVGATVPFAPALASSPSDFTLSIAFALPGPGPYLLAIDAVQHVWLYSEQNLNGTRLTGSITVYDTFGNVLFTVLPGTGGLYLPVQLASDPFGNMWALNSSLTLSKLGPNGAPLSPAAGFPVPITLPPNSNGDFGLGGKYMSVDPSGNLWGPNPGSSSNCYIEVSNVGAIITPHGYFCASAANSQTWFAATDQIGNAWFEGFQTVSKVNGSGVLVASGVTSNGCFDLHEGLPTDGSHTPQNLANTYYDEGITYNLLYDRVNNQLWGTTLVGAGALRSDGSQILCDPRGVNLPVIPNYHIGDDYNYSDGYLWMLNSPVLDGNGNLWFATDGLLSTKMQLPNPPYVAASVIGIGGLNAISSTGGLITPYNPAAGLYGLQAGLGNGFTGNMQIDGYGNIWMIAAHTDPLTSVVAFSLVKIPGLAAPKNYQ